MPGRPSTTRDAVLYLEIKRSTIHKWVQEGRIKSVRLPNRAYRIPQVEAVLARMVMASTGRAPLPRGD